MTDQQIEKTVSRILAERVPDAGFRGAEVRSDIDFDGESIIRVTARYDHRPAREDALIDVVHALRSELMKQGEERFVFLTNEIESERQHQMDLD
jgi:hypothetical protein